MHFMELFLKEHLYICQQYVLYNLMHLDGVALATTLKLYMRI